jgi:glycosyltransferase involved in cell wall biosynthesis
VRVLNIITSLSVGGAEQALVRVSTGLVERGHEVRVVGLGRWGPIGDVLERAGVEVAALGMHPAVPLPRGIRCLLHQLRDLQPDIVQTWLYHADLYGGLWATMLGRRNVVWNLRHCDLSLQLNSWHTLLAAYLCAWLSRWIPVRIVSNSQAAANLHGRVGYHRDKLQIIANGFDTDVYRPDFAARGGVRRELGLAEDALLVGFIARFDPQKDHGNFIRAARVVAADFPEARFLLAGKDVSWDNHVLAGWIRESGLEDRFVLLGRRDDSPRLAAALDVLMSSSSAESFSNAIGEAMACGVPCVVTDVGDSAAIVADTGRVVRAGCSEELGSACKDILGLSSVARIALSLRARERVVSNYSLEAMTDAYERLYEDLIYGESGDAKAGVVRRG